MRSNKCLGQCVRVECRLLVGGTSGDDSSGPARRIHLPPCLAFPRNTRLPGCACVRAHHVYAGPCCLIRSVLDEAMRRGRVGAGRTTYSACMHASSTSSSFDRSTKQCSPPPNTYTHNTGASIPSGSWCLDRISRFPAVATAAAAAAASDNTKMGGDDGFFGRVVEGGVSSLIN